jgi:ubiquinone/menaquinone biosynthesis C-methylase UbiE
MRVLDIGCGPNKTKDAIGADHHPYPGVDLVCDLDLLPWPLRDNSFDCVVASHVIEHVESIPDLMREIHRIGKHGASVIIMTPHYSSNDSWQDPTHRWHLGTRWHETFCEGYLRSQLPRFEFVSVDVDFPRKLSNLYVRLLVRYFGVNRWERRRAFRSPAKNMRTCLRIVKP